LINVYLLDYGSIEKVVKAARISHGSMSDGMGPRDKKLIRHLIRVGHESVFEHCSYTFKIEGVSRALLQELVRHRIASYTVRSTRFTLKDITKDMEIEKAEDLSDYRKIVDRYCVVPDIPEEALNEFYKNTALSLKGVYKFLREYNLSNDKVKYLLPESFKTELLMSINVRSFRNFLRLRSSKKALWEIRNLALEMYKVIPADHHILYEDLNLPQEE
jgi:thymidylate synthase (FAD)